MTGGNILEETAAAAATAFEHSTFSPLQKSKKKFWRKVRQVDLQIPITFFI